MRRLEIPKRGGGSRVVFAPSVKEKIALRQEMKRIVSHTPTTLPYAHGFMEGRSPLTAAMEHREFPVTINLDLKDFFPSVKPEMVRGLVPKDLNPLCWAGDGCGQGLPTAPMIANLAAKSLDEAVVKAFKKKERAGVIYRFAYTRYADDLSLSLDPDPGQEIIEAFKKQVTEIVTRCGFRPNPKKWRVLRAAGGRREVVGLLVGDMNEPIRPRKEWRHNFRAIEHKIAMCKYDLDIIGDPFDYCHSFSRARRIGEVRRQVENELARLEMLAKGWSQWAEPKVPVAPEERERRAQIRRIASRLGDANKLCRKASLPDLAPIERAIEEREEPIHGTSWVVRVTSDPVYYVGISDFVTKSQSTSSCIRLGLCWPGSRRGQYGGGGAWWWHLRGVSVAHVVDTKQMATGCGVSRPAQLARVLVFKTRNGDHYYQTRIYHGNDRAKAALERTLRSWGFRSIRETEAYARGGFLDETVVGNVPRDLSIQRPYLDHGRWDEARLTSGTKIWKVVI